MDLEQVAEERMQKRERQFRVKKWFGFRHGMIQATVDKIRRQCIGCNKRSICSEVPSNFYGSNEVYAKCNSEADAKSQWSGRHMAGHVLQNIFDRTWFGAERARGGALLIRLAKG